ncbi:MAG: Spy/CpxP family protein refolding chaperone [Chromatiales bacterium]|jgi:Spy/CpxP family protein refolding chaperone
MKTHIMKRHTRNVLLVVGGLALTTSLVMAGIHYADYRHDPGTRAEHIVQKLSEELELNPYQHEQLVALKDTLLSARQTVHGSRGELRGEMMELLEAPSLDRGAALALITRRAEALQQQAPELVNAVGDFHDSLSPEQRVELRKRIEERHALRQRLMEHRRWHSEEM